jgi:hypothetical protein
MNAARSGNGHCASELLAHLAAVRTLNDARAADARLDAALSRLGAWQARRLSQTYADLARSPRYADAIAFFQRDLYGGADFSKRDADLARIVPVLTRMLPERVIGVVAQAAELNLLSQRLDRAMVPHLPAAPVAGTVPFSVVQYARAFRRAGDFDARRRQIELIGEVGRAIDHYGQKRSIRSALALMRTPARAAGFGALQDFLERGFASFRSMRGADEFLAIVDARERAILDAIAGGADAPFADPGADASFPDPGAGG